MKSIDHEIRHESSTTQDGNQPEPVAVSKRALLKAAWVAPVVVALNLPRSSFAANISGSHSQGKGRNQEPKSNSGNHFGQLKKGG